MLLATRDFKIFDHGRLLDLKRFGFITHSRQTPCTLFASCTANETSPGFFKASERVSSPAACEGSVGKHSPRRLRAEAPRSALAQCTATKRLPLALQRAMGIGPSPAPC